MLVPGLAKVLHAKNNTKNNEPQQKPNASQLIVKS